MEKIETKEIKIPVEKTGEFSILTEDGEIKYRITSRLAEKSGCYFKDEEEDDIVYKVELIQLPPNLVEGKPALDLWVEFDSDLNMDLEDLGYIYPEEFSEMMALWRGHLPRYKLIFELKTDTTIKRLYDKREQNEVVDKIEKIIEKIRQKEKENANQKEKQNGGEE